MKKFLVLLSIITINSPFFSSTINGTTPTFVNLHAPILQLVDGMSIGFNGLRIYKIKILGKKLTELHHEISTTVKELTSCGLDADSNNEEVQRRLMVLKDKFHETTLPFMADMDGFRKIVLDLITDSCEKRHRTNSFLMTWGKCEEGKEHESIRTNLKTFKELTVFTVDLIHFLRDLIHNCPKGYAQYEELMRQQQIKQ